MHYFNYCIWPSRCDRGKAVTKYRKPAKEVRHGRVRVPAGKVGKELSTEAWKGRWGSCGATFTSRRGHRGRKDRGDLGEVLSVCWCVQDDPGDRHVGSQGLGVVPLSLRLEEFEGGEGHAVVPREQCPGDKVVPLQEWPNRAAGYGQPPTLGQAEGACGLGSRHHKEMFGEVCFQTRSTMARGGHEAGEGRGPGRCAAQAGSPAAGRGRRSW